MDLKRKVLNTIKKFSLISPGDTVLCAVSGGPDSVALLFILNEISKREIPISLYVAHFNHMLREESDEEESFVKEISTSLNVPFFSERKNLKKITGGKNIEDEARKERYTFLYSIAEKIGADKIATGHTASDLTETVIFNLVKGSGIKGLRGFLPKRGKVIRPLFEITKEEVEKYLKAKDIPYKIDPSNFSTKFSRNLIRLKVVPELKKINPSLEKTVLRETAILREAENFIKEEVEKVLNQAKISENRVEISISILKPLHPFILKEAVNELFFRISGEYLNTAKLEAVEHLIEKNESGEVNLKKGFIGRKDQRSFTIEKEQPLSESKVKIKITAETEKVETPSGTFIFNAKNPHFEIPKEVVEKGVFIKNREGSEWLQFPYGRKKLKKFFIEKKVPVKLRDSIPLMVTADNEVIWIPELFKKTYIKKDQNSIGVRFEGGIKDFDNRRRDKEKDENTCEGNF